MNAWQIEDMLLAQAEATRATIRTRRTLEASRAEFPVERPMPVWDEADFQARLNPHPAVPTETKSYTPSRFPWRAVIVPLALIALIVIAPFMAPDRAQAASGGDCILSQPTSASCGSQVQATARKAQMEANYEHVAGYITHDGVRWPATGDEMLLRRLEVKRLKAEATAAAATRASNTETTSSTDYFGSTTKEEPTARVAPVALETGGDFPLTSTQIAFLGVLLAGGLVLATKHFSPSLYSAGLGKVHALNSTVVPHAKDARRGLRKFLPGLYWMGDFKTGWGFVAKVILPLAVLLYAWHILGGLLGFWLRLVAILILLIGLGRIDGRKAAGTLVNSERWWDANEMSKAMIAAGIVPTPKKGEPMAMTRAVGGPQADQYGTRAKFDPPGHVVLADVMRRHASLAKALRVPADRLEITQGENDPEGTLTFWVGTAQAREVVSATVPEQGRHSADSDFMLGRGLKGEPVSMRTRNRQTLLAGQPGSGKTSLARRMILHWLADPKARVFVFDGKSNTDYVDGVEQYSAYVTQFGPANHDYVAQTEQLLTEVNRIVNDRNESRTVDKSGVLVVLDEFQEVLADADRATKERLEKLMASVTKRGRMANVHVLLATQEVRGDTIPTKVRAMFQQIIGFRVGRITEEPIIFGQQVSTKRPKADGELVIMSQGGESWVKSDFLDEPQWVEAVQSMAHRDSVRLTDVKPLPGLVLAVLEALEEEDGLEPQALFDRLSEEVRTATPASMGKALAKHEIASKKESGRNIYRLAAVRAAVQGL